MCKHNFTQNSGISERGRGQTHNETESSHSTASLIFILFMQGVGYLRSKFLPGCAGLGSRMVYAKSKLNFEFASLAGEGGCSFKGENREKQWNCL